MKSLVTLIKSLMRLPEVRDDDYEVIDVQVLDAAHKYSSTRATCSHSVAPFPIATRMP